MTEITIELKYRVTYETDLPIDVLKEATEAMIFDERISLNHSEQKHFLQMWVNENVDVWDAHFSEFKIVEIS
jgi:hypothetical protein